MDSFFMFIPTLKRGLPPVFLMGKYGMCVLCVNFLLWPQFDRHGLFRVNPPLLYLVSLCMLNCHRFGRQNFELASSIPRSKEDPLQVPPLKSPDSLLADLQPQWELLRFTAFDSPWYTSPTYYTLFARLFLNNLVPPFSCINSLFIFETKRIQTTFMLAIIFCVFSPFLINVPFEKRYRCLLDSNVPHNPVVYINVRINCNSIHRILLQFSRFLPLVLSLSKKICENICIIYF